ncbi:MAG TPA: hypothetical protein VGT24_04380 [Candidatus Acidoferrales bacterium]|nr:hypothetical protein [Candidatus Acidoferrales bacterium]
MAKTKKFELDGPPLVIEDEDEMALTAIDEGIHDAKAGRTTPIEEIRKLMQKWVSPKY